MCIKEKFEFTALNRDFVINPVTKKKYFANGFSMIKKLLRLNLRNGFETTSYKRNVDVNYHMKRVSRVGL